MADKDFLSQFSEEGKKPDSFKEEVLTPVAKERKPLNKGLLVGIIILLIIIIFLIWWLFLRARIEMPNFVGETKNDLSAWVKQYDIDAKGIILKEEYNFDHPEGTIIDQSIESGKKIKENAKIDFVVSLGPDPEEAVNFPDLKSMDKNDVQDFIDSNKLLKTKMVTQYSETVETGKVISYELKGVAEDEFKRGSQLTVYISKGVAPEDEIAVENFVGQAAGSAESWAKSKKLEYSETEVFSSTVDAGLIVSQSPAKGTLKKGDKFTVTVSKGKGVSVPDFKSMSKTGLESYMSGGSDLAVTIGTEKYSGSGSYVLDQSVAAGRMVEIGTTVRLTVNKGSGWYLDDEGVVLDGGAVDRLSDKVNSLGEIGINIKLKKTEVESAETKGMILSHKIYTSKKEYSDIEKLPLSITIEVEVSNGAMAPVTPETPESFYLTEDDIDVLNNKHIDRIKDLIANYNAQGYNLTVDVIEGPSASVEAGFPIETKVFNNDLSEEYSLYAKLPADAKFVVTVSTGEEGE